MYKTINNSLITGKLPCDTTNLYTIQKKETLIYWPTDDYNYTLSLPQKTKTSHNNHNNNTNLKAHITNRPTIARNTNQTKKRDRKNKQLNNNNNNNNNNNRNNNNNNIYNNKLK